MADITSSWNYLPVEKDSLLWGLHVTSAGSNECLANTPYPPKRHPDEYLFSWEDGRTLEEYQLVYITKGRGVLETSEASRKRIEAGQIFLLFPGVWHRFHPLKKEGWDENWIGFNGEVAERIMSAFFSPSKPVVQIGFDQELLSVIHSLSKLMKEDLPGVHQLMAARTMEALALIHSHAMSKNDIDRKVIKKVQQARYFLLQHSAEEIDMQDLAKETGMSYSRFRLVFKELTGRAPHQYHLDIRMNKARDLLLHSTLSISEIADRLGFASAYYFSRIFKQRNGCSPSIHREYKGKLKY
jgi:AraC-like DNA-binding protein